MASLYTSSSLLRSYTNPREGVYHHFMEYAIFGVNAVAGVQYLQEEQPGNKDNADKNEDDVKDAFFMPGATHFCGRYFGRRGIDKQDQ